MEKIFLHEKKLIAFSCFASSITLLVLFITNKFYPVNLLILFFSILSLVYGILMLSGKIEAKSKPLFYYAIVAVLAVVFFTVVILKHFNPDDEMEKRRKAEKQIQAIQ